MKTEDMKSNFAKYWKEKDLTQEDLKYFDGLVNDYRLCKGLSKDK